MRKVDVSGTGTDEDLGTSAPSTGAIADSRETGWTRLPDPPLDGRTNPGVAVVGDEINRGLGDTILPAIVASVDNHMGGCWEDAFRDHLRRQAADIHAETIAIGSWWRTGGQDEIDAVVLAGRSRTPVVVGEAKWARSVDGGRVASRLAGKAARLTDNVEDLRLAICAPRAGHRPATRSADRHRRRHPLGMNMTDVAVNDEASRTSIATLREAYDRPAA